MTTHPATSEYAPLARPDLGISDRCRGQTVIVISPSEDAWGRALLDHLAGRPTPDLVIETGQGVVSPMMRPEWFFRGFEEWDWWEQRLLPLVERGPVLDLGCAAGRAALYFQERGLEVTAVDSSPGAAATAAQRGVLDARVGDLNDPPADRAWGAVLLLCGNLGLGGSWTGNRALLLRLAEIATPGAILIGDSVNPRDAADVRFRIRYGSMTTPWWPQRNIASLEIKNLIEGTGWALEQHFEDGEDHAVLLRLGPTS